MKIENKKNKRQVVIQRHKVLSCFEKYHKNGGFVEYKKENKNKFTQDDFDFLINKQ